MKFNALLLLPLAGITFGLASVASADTIQIPYSIPATSLSASSPTPFSASVAQFNPALGTLTSVTITENVTVTPFILLYNFGSTDQPFTSSCSIDFSITDPLGNTTAGTAATGLLSGVVPAFTSSTAFSLAGPADVLSQISGSPASLTPYLGTGNVSLDFNAISTGTYGGSPGTPVFHGGSRTYVASGTVTYTYEVPEPASLALLTLGALGLLRRRRAA